MRQRLPLLLAGVAALLGVLLLVLAVDVARVERSIAVDDARFLAQPRVEGYWEDDGLLPFALGRRAAGVQDDVERRRAIRLFWSGRPREGLTTTPRRLAERAKAQAALAASEELGGPGASYAATLLGVLALLSPPGEAERAQVVRAAAAAFRRAIVLDEGNDHAKYNLESILRLVADDRNRGQGGGGSAGQDGTEFGGAAVSRRGSGY